MAPTEPLRFPVSLSVNLAQESVIAYSLSASEFSGKISTSGAINFAGKFYLCEEEAYPVNNPSDHNLGVNSAQ